MRALRNTIISSVHLDTRLAPDNKNETPLVYYRSTGELEGPDHRATQVLTYLHKYIANYILSIHSQRSLCLAQDLLELLLLSVQGGSTLFGSFWLSGTRCGDEWAHIYYVLRADNTKSGFISDCRSYGAGHQWYGVLICTIDTRWVGSWASMPEELMDRAKYKYVLRS